MAVIIFDRRISPGLAETEIHGYSESIFDDFKILSA